MIKKDAMTKNKEHMRNEDEDRESLKKTGQKDGDDKAKENEIKGWHNYEVQQEKVVNDTRKTRKKRNKRTGAKQCILKNDEGINADINKKVKTETDPIMKINDKLQQVQRLKRI